MNKNEYKVLNLYKYVKKRNYIKRNFIVAIYKQDNFLFSVISYEGTLHAYSVCIWE